jgi:hypothetical protein
MHDTTGPSAPLGPTYDEAMLHGMGVGSAALQLAASQSDPVVTIEFSGIRLTIEPGACCLRGAEHPEDLTPNQMLRLSGFLAGISHAYRLAKEMRA